MDDKPRFSRRSVLKTVILLTGTTCAGSLLSRREALAQQKATQAAMKYQNKPNGDQKCSNCLQFESPSSCKVVEGKISPEGYCIAWVKKP